MFSRIFWDNKLFIISCKFVKFIEAFGGFVDGLESLFNFTFDFTNPANTCLEILSLVVLEVLLLLLYCTTLSPLSALVILYFTYSIMFGDFL
jgi:hypothetical protein